MAIVRESFVITYVGGVKAHLFKSWSSPLMGMNCILEEVLSKVVEPAAHDQS